MERLGRCLPAAAFFTSCALLAVDLKLSPVFAYRIQQPDFYVYYLAAQLGRTRGWAVMYDPSVFQPMVTGVVGKYLPYLNPPPLAWLVTPLSVLPYSIAAWLWSGILAAALIITWFLTAPGSWPRRSIHLLAATAALPVFVSFLFGEVSLLIVAMVAASFVLLERGRPWLAGIVLAGLCLKPQVAFLVPIGLLAAGYGRVVLSWLIASAGLVALSLLAVGTHAVHDVQRSLALAAGTPGPIQVSLLHQVRSPVVAGIAMLAVAAAFLVVAWRSRALGPELPMAAGLVASVMLSPYLNFYDLAGVVLAGWLVLRAGPPAWQQALMIGFYGALYLAPVWPLLTVSCEFAWLVSLVFVTQASHDRASSAILASEIVTRSQ